RRRRATPAERPARRDARWGEWPGFAGPEGTGKSPIDRRAQRRRRAPPAEPPMTDLDDRIARPSPAQQALPRQLAGANAQTALTIPRRPPDAAPAPLSFAQQRLWFLDQLEPGTARYHICRRFQLAGSLDVDRLIAALDALVARHAILHTTFELR